MSFVMADEFSGLSSHKFSRLVSQNLALQIFEGLKTI